MKPLAHTALIVSTLACSLSPSAWAGKKQRPAQAPAEVYSAVDASTFEPSEELGDVRLPAEQPKTPASPQALSPKPAALPRPTKIAAISLQGSNTHSNPYLIPSPSSPARGFYDAVPSNQVDALAKRLKLAEALIRRHGRAYDYRVHTIKELETILIALDGPAHRLQERDNIASKPSVPPQAQAQSRAQLQARDPSDQEAAPAPLPTPSEADEMDSEALSAQPSI